MAVLYILVLKDADKSIAEYEKKTGKKIVVKPISLSEDAEAKLNIFEKVITTTLTTKWNKKKDKSKGKMKKNMLRKK